MNLRSWLARSALLRKFRARLPYRLQNWQARAMSYWQWNEGSAAMVSKNICGPASSLESIDSNRESIVWLAQPCAQDVCLDLGCGIGRVEKFLAPKVREVHAVDFSETMIRIARERLKGISNVYLYQNDGETLNIFPDEMFDLAWAELVFHHVPIEITIKYLREIARVLKSGGRFVCQFPRKDFYDRESRDICGWMTLPEAERLVQPLFNRAKVWQDKRHIYAQVMK